MLCLRSLAPFSLINISHEFQTCSGKLFSAYGAKLSVSDMHDKSGLAQVASIFNDAIYNFENLSH